MVRARFRSVAVGTTHVPLLTVYHPATAHHPAISPSHHPTTPPPHHPRYGINMMLNGEPWYQDLYGDETHPDSCAFKR